MIFGNILSYALASIKLALTRPECFKLRELIKYFPAWCTTLNIKYNTLTAQTPWICFAAIDYLDKLITKDMRIYEFGCGGSTLFFASRAKEVYSVEHNLEWFNKVLNVVQSENINNCKIGLQETATDCSDSQVDPANPYGYASGGEYYRGMTFEKYAASIDQYPDEFFDIVLIDGRARPSCFQHSITKVKKGGCLILDNAEREYYSYIHKTLNNLRWEKKVFYGPLPLVKHFSETCIWEK